jgi:hypothetical protein
MKQNKKQNTITNKERMVHQNQTIIGFISRNAEPASLGPQKRGALLFSEQE